MKFKKNSLTWIFVQSTILIVGIVVLLFGIFYRFLFPTYYYWKLEKPVKETEKIIKQSKSPKADPEIIILKVKNFSYLSPDEINNELSAQLINKRNILNKFWITPETIKKVKAGQTIQRLYSQSSQKNDFYSRYFSLEDNFYVVGTSIPSFKEVTSVILPLIIVTLLFIVLLLITTLTHSVRKNIIEPLENLEALTRKISKRDFTKINFNRENELSLLTDSINDMSHSLKLYERDLLNKNNKLKNFSRNLAHELKTPLSALQLIIDSQEMGIKNENYVEDLNIQIANINELIERILNFSQQEKEQVSFGVHSINQLIEAEVGRVYHINPHFKCDLNIPKIDIQTSLPHFQIILQNIFSNALKYSKDGKLSIKGKIDNKHCFLVFSNKSETYSEKDLQRILESFEVGDISRNQSLSGTGLGFSIIEQALLSLDGRFEVTQENDIFILELRLPLNISA